MGKAIITLSDVEDKKEVRVDVEFAPNLVDGDEGTLAQTMAVKMFKLFSDWMETKMKEGK